MPLLLIVTVSVFIAYYFLFIRLKLDSPHQIIILAGLFGCAQIILTELYLGIAGLLYLPFLNSFNILIALVMILCAWGSIKSIPAILKKEYQKIVNAIGTMSSPDNKILLLILGFVLIWVSRTIYFYLSRHFDEVTYHLPAIYEYIINHKIFLLPVEINSRFAFPENAELLFLWPAIFLHSQQLVDSVQLIVALGGGVVLYGLARMMGIHPKIALFISFLFLLTPVVLFQMGSCDIDIIISVFFLIVLYCAGMYYRSGLLIYFYSTALAAGLLWGMKYNEIIFILMAFPFLSMRRPVRLKYWLGFIVIFLIAGGFWYLRNFLVLKTPIYPMPFSDNSLNIYTTHSSNVDLGGILKAIPSKILYLWKDPGLGTLNGGYGLIFWGLALPAWFYVWIRSIKLKDRFDFWMYSPLVIGIGQLMFVSWQDLNNVVRYSLFVVAIGLLALGKVMMLFDRMAFFRKAIKVLCIIFIVLTVLYLNQSRDSRYRRNRIDLLNQNIDQIGPSVWGALDYLTMDDPKPISCHIATMDDRYNLSSFAYGMKLQNRIWDLQEDKTILPDAFIYFDNYRTNFSNFIGPRITLEEMKVNANYLIIFQGSGSSLFIRKDFFRDPIKQQLLVNYFKIFGKMPLVSIPK